MTAPDATDVEILLACYNGERYLGEMLASLAAQRCDRWRLTVRDDGSSDATVDLLDAFAAGPGRRVALLRDGRGNLGPGGNFSALLDAADGRYIMFADQDDVWLPDKIARALTRMEQLEAELGSETPILVHADLKVTDVDLTVRAESFWRYQKLDPNCRRLGRLLVANNVTGCAVMINAALRELACPVPNRAVMHDWWLALVAAAFGRIEPLRHADILYRQHGGNDVGAKRFTAGYVLGKLGSFNRPGGLADRLARAQRQAAAFAERFAEDLAPADLAAARAYGAIASKGPIARRAALVRHGLLMHGRGLSGFVKNLGLFLRI